MITKNLYEVKYNAESSTEAKLVLAASMLDAIRIASKNRYKEIRTVTLKNKDILYETDKA